jgi:hypothetical protein
LSITFHSGFNFHLGQIAMLTGRKIRWDWKAEEIIDDPAAASLLWREPRTEWAKA